jgi:hypothetical protein
LIQVRPGDSYIMKWILSPLESGTIINA